MKREIIFTCDICNTRYDTDELALQCEAKGQPDLPARGILYGANRGAVYGLILNTRHDGHRVVMNGVHSDFVREHYESMGRLNVAPIEWTPCQSPNFNIYEDVGVPDFTQPLFWWSLFARSSDITERFPTVWNGAEEVRWEQFVFDSFAFKGEGYKERALNSWFKLEIIVLTNEIRSLNQIQRSAQEAYNQFEAAPASSSGFGVGVYQQHAAATRTNLRKASSRIAYSLKLTDVMQTFRANYQTYIEGLQD